jgi:hypothetical protein
VRIAQMTTGQGFRDFDPHLPSFWGQKKNKFQKFSLA